VLAFVLWGARKRRWAALSRCVLAVLAISSMTSCGGSTAAVTKPPAPVIPPATSVQFSISAPYLITTGPWTGNGGNDFATVTVNINP
jgi:hypothetical protein